MTAKVRHIKKEDLNAPAPAAKAEASAVPKELSTAVKSWVKEFQDDRREGSLQSFESLFDDSTP